MKKYLMTRRSVYAALLGLVVGFVGAKFLVQGNPIVTLPWALIAFGIAFYARTRLEAVTLGGVFGFIAAYSYLWFDRTGELSIGQAILLVFIVILPALFGLICAAACSWIGWLVRQKF